MDVLGNLYCQLPIDLVTYLGKCQYGHVVNESSNIARRARKGLLPSDERSFHMEHANQSQDLTCE